MRRLLEGLAGRLELPGEVLLDLPKVTLIGELQVLIENHRGVIEYTAERVRVATARGELAVVGRRLRIGSIFESELVIEGRIAGIELKG
ncbi:MAG TPA: sporulation protein YqfC [Limnochordia bacterium]